uniref:Uncharacterized protein n=1 Tax=Aegilops tauschii TaxID=37682 RepID=R7W8I6_AEGTA
MVKTPQRSLPQTLRLQQIGRHSLLVVVYGKVYLKVSYTTHQFGQSGSSLIPAHERFFPARNVRLNAAKTQKQLSQVFRKHDSLKGLCTISAFL